MWLLYVFKNPADFFLSYDFLCMDSILGFHPKIYFLVQDGCSSSSNHIHIPTNRKNTRGKEEIREGEEKGVMGWTDSPKRYAEVLTPSYLSMGHYSETESSGEEVTPNECGSQSNTTGVLVRRGEAQAQTQRGGRRGRRAASRARGL